MWFDFSLTLDFQMLFFQTELALCAMMTLHYCFLQIKLTNKKCKMLQLNCTNNLSSRLIVLKHNNQNHMKKINYFILFFEIARGVVQDIRSIYCRYFLEKLHIHSVSQINL